MNKFWIALALSLIFHLSQYGLLEYSTAISRQNSSPVEVEILEQKDSDQQNNRPQQTQFVENTQDQKPIQDNKDPRFFAERQQRVEKETKARQFGVNRNAGVTRPATQNQENRPREDGGTEPEFVRAMQQQMQQSLPSQIQSELPADIDFGSATNLNADAHIYASFYNRVENLFYIRWVQKLNSIWARLSYETKKEMSGRVWSTDVEIWLRANGEYDRGLVMKRSGFRPFDDAGIFAFKDAKFFPNPPPAKVESDGFIRLRYRINIQIR